MRKGKLLGIILMKALRIRTGKYDEESGIFPGFPTEETAVQNMISIMELHWRIWNPESSYNSEEKSFGQILPCFPPCRMPGNGGIPALAVETFPKHREGKMLLRFLLSGTLQGADLFGLMHLWHFCRDGRCMPDHGSLKL